MQARLFSMSQSVPVTGHANTTDAKLRRHFPPVHIGHGCMLRGRRHLYGHMNKVVSFIAGQQFGNRPFVPGTHRNNRDLCDQPLIEPAVHFLFSEQVGPEYMAIFWAVQSSLHTTSGFRFRRHFQSMIGCGSRTFFAGSVCPDQDPKGLQADAGE